MIGRCGMLFHHRPVFWVSLLLPNYLLQSYVAARREIRPIFDSYARDGVATTLAIGPINDDLAQIQIDRLFFAFATMYMADQ